MKHSDRQRCLLKYAKLRRRLKADDQRTFYRATLIDAVDLRHTKTGFLAIVRSNGVHWCTTFNARPTEQEVRKAWRNRNIAWAQCSPAPPRVIII
jgi:hypothetical protein